MIKRLSTIGLLAAAAVSFSGMAVAADSGQSGASGQSQQLMQGYRQDAQQLKQIHDQTIKNNPQLAKQQKQFESQVKAAVKKQGYDVDAGEKRMEKYAKQLQNKDLSDDKRKAVMQKFQNERQQMVKARNAAMQQDDIQQAGKQLQNSTLQAMNKQNGKTDDLISDMKSKRSQLQQSMGSAQGGNSGN
ncbi:hypothetical protein [Salinisphaera sp. Q1T1-3]|uniref:hypothetical protein n=1 Tax=Salinisphaera sp. Q1T1-3 TaxID=2321229 RepID=UPI000E7632DD|nr:hypothetical protein [Salinisphaera sp. Q1T1-3]RJS94271.1 hypothetical protein D3260_03930 [Salinisphaera sp. Q1T1-3]